jgi:hypothetical protein
VATKKITDLSAAGSVTADDLLLTVDMAGPTTYKITVANFFGSVPSNALFTANVTVYGTTTANTLVATGNTTFNTGNTFVTANNVMIKRTATPAATTDVVSAGTIGLLWSDGNYIYLQANATHNKRVAIATW